MNTPSVSVTLYTMDRVGSNLTLALTFANGVGEGVAFQASPLTCIGCCRCCLGCSYPYLILERHLSILALAMYSYLPLNLLNINVSLGQQVHTMHCTTYRSTLLNLLPKHWHILCSLTKKTFHQTCLCNSADLVS